MATVAARSKSSRLPGSLGIVDPRHRRYYADYNLWIEEMAATPACDPSKPSPSLPADCYESVALPSQLYRKLDEWGFDNIVIPHGTSWGFYTPPGANWRHQLREGDPERTGLIEVYSGHGNSEVYRDFAVRRRDDKGNWYCPEPQANYLPACWQAGNIIRQRCLAEGLPRLVCEQRVTEARHNFVQIDTIHGFMTVPDSQPEEWLDAGQARDVFLPAFNYRPRKSAQYGLALRDFRSSDEGRGYRWGFVASTDTHSARAGHGFKQQHRKPVTDANGIRGPFWESLSRGTAKIPPPTGRSLTVDQIDPVSAKLYATEFQRIEIIKIRPQLDEEEPIAELIQDPWRVFDCEPSEAGCSVEFTDSSFAEEGREAVYYVRVLEEPIPTINAENMRAEFDEMGDVKSTSPCRGDYGTNESDDCLGSERQRAWSSPIFVSYSPGASDQVFSAR